MNLDLNQFSNELMSLSIKNGFPKRLVFQKVITFWHKKREPKGRMVNLPHLV